LRIAVGSALKSEILHLRTACATSRPLNRKTQRANPMWFLTGVGQLAALRSVANVIADQSPDAIVFVGCAGSLSSDLRIGNVVICKEIAGSLNGQRVVFKSSASLLQKALPFFKDKLSMRVGDVFSATKFVSSRGAQAKRSALYGLCVETEGLALAIACNWGRIPWVMFRVITDHADTNKRPTSRNIRRVMKAASRPIGHFLNSICGSARI
jgi:nucleoside phosphorylase